MEDSLKITRNYTVLSPKCVLVCDAPIRKAEGVIGRLECADATDMKINAMTPVWSAKYPPGSCGGERDKDTMCVMIAPGLPNNSSVMIDDFTYVTCIDIP